MCMQPTATSQVQNANSNLVIDNSITYFMLLVLYVLLFIRRIVDWIIDSKLIKCNSTLSLLVRVCLFNIFSISNRAPSALNHRTHVYINDSLFPPIYCIILYGLWTEDLRRLICIPIQSIQILEIPKPKKTSMIYLNASAHRRNPNFPLVSMFKSRQTILKKNRN